MTLASGQMLDQYRLIEKIGEGGMGVVWKARDTTLDRDVAIKVLPAEFVRDADRLARFEREAKAVAALSHPNIVAIHGFGTGDGTAYAAIELLEGRSLREHLDEGPLPPRKALEVARQVATGLDAAHAKGIVHRDLKPDNVFLSSDGRARILDFGLAVVAEVVKNADSVLATRAVLTNPGAVMGTVAYMSPEQARGDAADSRSDIFSLGTMLHEMLTGGKPFQRETAAETMTAILREDPAEITMSGRPAPPAVSRLIARCLEKTPDERFQSARDLAFALENAAHESSSSQPAVGPRGQAPSGKRNWVWAALPLVAALAFIAGKVWQPAPAVVEPPRVTQLTFTGEDHQPNVSPDGRLIAFTSSRTGISQVWLRQVVGGGEQPLTEGPDWRPRFSPDGTSVSFIHGVGDDIAAYRVPVVGGQPRKLIEEVIEVEWSPDGRQLAFLRGASVADTTPGTQIGLLDIETGEERILQQMEGWDLFGLGWSPDGSRLSVVRASIQGASGDWRLLLIDPATAEIQELDAGDPNGLLSAATWAGPSALLFAYTNSTVIKPGPSRVVRYDLHSKEETVLFWAPYLFPFRGSLNGATQLGVIDDRSLVFDTFLRKQTLHEISLDGGGGRELLGGLSVDRQPAYHPDGSRVLFTSTRSGNVDLFSYEFETGKLLQLTDHLGNDWDAAYTPDGSSILWGSDRSGSLEVWTADLDGSNPRQITHNGVASENPTMTRDGQWIVFSSGGSKNPGLYKSRSDGSEEQLLIPGNWTNPEVSPDGRYALHVSTDNARLENIVRVIDIETGAVTPFGIEVAYNLRSRNVTYGRGRWMPDGKSIVFVGLDEQGRTGLWIQEFRTDRNAPETRKKLVGFDGDLVHESFGISPDGKRIVVSSIDQVRTINRADLLPALR